MRWTNFRKTGLNRESGSHLTWWSPLGKSGIIMDKGRSNSYLNGGRKLYQDFVIVNTVLLIIVVPRSSLELSDIIKVNLWEYEDRCFGCLVKFISFGHVCTFIYYKMNQISHVMWKLQKSYHTKMCWKSEICEYLLDKSWVTNFYT